jgi:FAD:protein FMN transferase
MSKLVEIERTFQAMNTTVTGIICETPAKRMPAEKALTSVERLFRLVEKRLSRFDPESELGALNRQGGIAWPASPILIRTVEAALEGARLTSGIFDPTLLPNLEAAGYDRSFEKISAGGAAVDYQRSVPRSDWAQISVDSLNGTIRLPAGCSLDLGGIGKGWAVDRACLILRSFANFALDGGGDIRVQGRQVDGDDWSVGVADPRQAGCNLTTLHLSGGAICTSTTAKRRWQAGGLIFHHLIDPRSGQPAESGVISSTVIADTAVRAEVLAKAALIAGPIRGLQLIEKQSDGRGLLVLDDGAILTTGMEVPQSVA